MIVPSCASWLTTESSPYGYRLGVVIVNISSPELCSSASAVNVLIFSYFLLFSHFLFPIIFLLMRKIGGKGGLSHAIINQTVFTLDMFQTGSKNISMIDFSETYLCA